MLFPLSLQAYQTAVKSTAKAGEQVMLTCKIWNEPANTAYISLYEQIGLAYREVARGDRQPDNTFLLKIPAGKARMYNIGFNETMNGRVIVGEEKQFTLYSNAEYMGKARTTGSPANKGLEDMLKRIEFLSTNADQLHNDLRMAHASRDEAAVKLANTRLVALNTQKKQFLDSLKAGNPILWRSATLQLSPDFYDGQAGYTDELDFNGKAFFGFANLSDPAYEETPDVFDAFLRFVTVLPQLGANTATTKQLADEQLGKLKPGSNTYRRALAGIIAGFKAGNHPDFFNYSKKYIETFKQQDLGEISRMEYDLKQTSTFTPGMEAPDLVGNTPEGQPYSLSKLRGKYVLVDFWASWCGPCRRENPNVKLMYEKYKGKGFDILGVSLDREEGAWKKAIEQDGLIWHHISDLKGWSSEHARLYSVSSIPQTLLLDREGKIVQRNLRGEQLGEKLKEIFGE